MDWEKLRRSGNVQDRRGRGVPGGVAIGGGGALIIAIISMLLGVNPASILGQGGNTSGNYPSTPQNDRAAEFAGRILGSTEDVWTGIFQKSGRTYNPTTLVLYEGATRSGCGNANSAVGPFYCPRDQGVYLDLSFFNDLATRFGAPGEFANAYVIAHEVAHHVQDELGISDRVAQQQARADQRTANALSVRLELQADCFAGVWAHHVRNQGIVDVTDVRAAINAAQAIGDDRLQRASQGYVVPDSFTHGSSAQRAAWFQRGLENGDPNSCDTFSQ